MQEKEKWDFVKDHQEIEKKHQKLHEELNRKKETVFRKLIGAEKRVGIGIQDSSLPAKDCCLDHIAGYVESVSQSRIVLNTIKPHEDHRLGKQRWIDLKDIWTAGIAI